MGPLSGRSAMEDETDLANFALDYAMKKGVSYAEARYEHQEEENFILKNGGLDAPYVGQDRGVGVRGLVHGAPRVGAPNPGGECDLRASAHEPVQDGQAPARQS